LIFCFLLLNYFFIFVNLVYGFIFLFLIIGFFIFRFFFRSYFSKSKYSFIGRLRVAARALSFDAIFIFFNFYLIIIFKDLVFLKINYFFSFFYFVLLFFFIILVELNRAPLDFAESERELVRGFNTELNRFLFIFVFLAE